MDQHANPYSPPLAHGGYVAPSDAWRRYGGFVPLETRMTLASIAIVLTVLGNLAFEIAELSFDGRLEVEKNGVVPIAVTGLCLLWLFVATIASAVLYCLWIHRAASNIRALGGHMTFSPGACVGWFFVPIASLFKPYRAVAELWVASDPEAHGQTRIIRFWWTTWIIASIFNAIGGRMSNMSLAGGIGLWGTFFGAMAAFGCISVMREISQRQLQSAARVTGVP